MIMTQILYQICFVTFLESKYYQNGQCSDKTEWGLSEGMVKKGYPEKKLKIATFAEAPFMVKLDF